LSATVPESQNAVSPISGRCRLFEKAAAKKKLRQKHYSFSFWSVHDDNDVNRPSDANVRKVSSVDYQGQMSAVAKRPLKVLSPYKDRQ